MWEKNSKSAQELSDLFPRLAITESLSILRLITVNEIRDRMTEKDAKSNLEELHKIHIIIEAK